MRDVTDNVTGELDVEVKRGRGRPRKEGALTNAQRQAAFRARRRDNAVTVTKKVIAPVQDVDAYDECRIEVETLRSELAEAREKIMGLSIGIENKHKAMLRAERERDEALAAAKKGAGKSLAINGSDADVVELSLQLLEIACKRKTIAGRNALYKSTAWKRAFDLVLKRELYERFSDCVFGPDLDPVTGKVVTKKGAQ
ncbi:hypothetical protein HpMS107_35170 [Helicobacter pylori]|uniref:hypothetical protein n=1 Tax=Cupriavidus sp. SHE TaxID=1539143 RepID=UPI0004AF8CF0|nr:hypothetical protein [Cupriavidus sp. SHE]